MDRSWGRYEYQPSFILAFHGCDKKLGEKVLSGKESGLRWSEKEYDWLGHGIYFWEGNPARAFNWAVERQKAEKIKTPFVLGAILDLKHCLDLFDSGGLQQVSDAFSTLEQAFKASGQPLLKNVGSTPDKAGRQLDCAVINALHKYRERENLLPYDSVRGPFLEGPELYEGAGFRRENHIQICVRSQLCIKGYFRPISES